MVMLVAAQPTPTLPCRDLATMPGNRSSSSVEGRGAGSGLRGWQWLLRKKGPLAFAAPDFKIRSL
ncbi:rCG50765 [Rattus norvegicus]|uniref:RCG50765 n=1 Tax=Rattus norvegicus TaxID=10116 RepID=A6KCB0_RAT|nr:rCG50765 [Rattus norvegicus]